MERSVRIRYYRMMRDHCGVNELEVLKQAIGSIRFFLTASIGVLKGEEVGQSSFFS